jgi:hypothetical protein|nr:MAG TPA: Transcriptional regulator [Caudoviricetes sp.]
MDVRRYIETPAWVRKELKTQLGVGESTVTHALLYTRSGEVSEEIRSKALEYDESSVMISIPEGQAMQIVGEELHCYLNGGVQLISNLKTGLYEVYRGAKDGTPIISGWTAPMDELGKIIELVSNM